MLLSTLAEGALVLAAAMMGATKLQRDITRLDAAVDSEMAMTGLTKHLPNLSGAAVAEAGISVGNTPRLELAVRG
jgi:hypothetical protein